MRFPPELPESALGYATSVVTGVATYSGVALSQSMGVPAERLVAPAAVFGNLLGYALDVLFAKSFPEGTSLAAKAAALGASFATPMFARFLVTVCVDVLVNSVAVDFARGYLADTGALASVPDKVRDGLVIFAVSALSFMIVINTLRFGWAYTDEPDPVVSVVVGMSLATLMCVSMLYFRDRRPGKDGGRGSGFFTRPLALSTTLV